MSSSPTTFLIKKSILLMVLSSLAFSIMGVLVKYSCEYLPVWEVAFFRGISVLVILLVYMGVKQISFKSNQRWQLIFRGILGSISLLGYFYTISKMKLADANILFQLSPVFVILFAFIFLSEKLHKLFYIMLFVSFVGVVLVIKPDFDIINNLAGIVGVLTAILSAGAYVTVRFLARTNHSSLIVFYFVAISTIISFPLALIEFKVPTFLLSLAVIGIGVSSFLGQMLMTEAYKIEKAGIVSMVGYISIFFNVLWGYLFWGEILDTYSLLGGGLILMSCISLNLVHKVD